MSTSTNEVYQSAPEAAGESDLDARVARLAGKKDRWAHTPVSERIELLDQIKHCLMEVAEDWAETAAEEKQIPKGSPLVGEEWTSGPYALMTACNALTVTLSKLHGKTFLDDLDVRTVRDGQIAIRVLPHTVWDHLLLSGIKADIWDERGRKRRKSSPACGADLRRASGVTHRVDKPRSRVQAILLQSRLSTAFRNFSSSTPS